ncbi:hypothetical protein IMX26_06080 [Clostridium sp. 'deep sea']|uniref:hypothetical protein n=1 Tax=Clostridium sp. 'deep sea' TaxID=2779445 RepID=UPI0018969212|nr:hypothetical protein [Clostridium sp. 'deep sea']QOR36380.1 hypothetical protein IMX26_06080 [Clostridium sp. 'deep sea']
MRKLIIAVILLITLALGIFLYLNEPKNTELNSIKPLKYTKQQTELLETLNLKDKVKVFKFNYDKSVEVVNVSVSLYCKGSLVHENNGLTYIYDDNITDVNNQLKNGEIVLNYSTDKRI